MDFKQFSCIMMLLIGIIFTGFAVDNTFRVTDILSRAVQTQAIVVDLQWEDLSDGSSAFPVVRFTDIQRMEHIAKSRVGSNFIFPNIGDEWIIWYDPENPEDDVLTLSYIWFTPLFMVVSLSLFAAGLLLLMKSRPRKP